MNAAWIGLLWGALKYVVAQPIVKVALDNWTKGTSNKIDDMIWKMLKQAAGITDLIDREAFAVREAARIQAVYDSEKIAGTLDALKADKRVIQVVGDFLSSGDTA